MVLETVVSSLLSKYLATYIENLQRDQLEVRFLRGGVLLKDLVLKQSALDDFNLPIRIFSGSIGELEVKIPWTTLFASKTKVHIKGLYLLISPNPLANKESKSKQLQLQLQENKAHDKAGTVDQQNGLAAKLYTLIIQNLLVTVENVHIRFEDNITNPSHPFACGITLKKLALESTDSSWNPNENSRASNLFFKRLSVEALAVYWLSDASQFFSNMLPQEQVGEFRRGIADVHTRPYEDSYLAGPITSHAQLRINTRPELSNYTMPKISLELTMEEISLRLTPNQYRDFVGFLSNIERLKRGLIYRKYRPANKSYKGKSKVWWHFAYQCVLKENVRKWNWANMKKHRDLFKKYSQLYEMQLEQKKVDLKLNKSLEELEDGLDVFNIILARNEAKLKVEKRKPKEQQREEAGGGWLSSWFGWAAPNTSLQKEFKEMTRDEETQLYTAIGYEKKATTAIYPETFIENRFKFSVARFKILLHDSINSQQRVILLSTLSRVEATVEQRPAAQALFVNVKAGDFVIDGADTLNLVHRMEGNEEILNLVYETNPVDKSCDKRIRLTAEKLRITYDVKTLRKIRAMFESKEASQLAQLTAAAKQKLKKMSALGLEYAIENHDVMDVDVNVKGSHFNVPYGGSFQNNSSKILCNMGNLFIKSNPTRKRGEVPIVSQRVRDGSSKKDILDEMHLHSYDKFSVGFTVQVYSVLPNDDWTEQVTQNNQDFSILKPMRIELLFEKCIQLVNPTLPKFKISGKLPLIHVDLLDTRLFNMLAVLKSIPSLAPKSIRQEVVAKMSTQVKHSTPEEPLTQATTLELQFEFEDVRFSLSRTRESPLTEISIRGLELDATVRRSITIYQFKLEEFLMTDPQKDTLYREIVSVVDDQAIQLKVEVHKNATKDANSVDLNKVDFAIHLKMGRMKAVYLSSFVRDLLAFIKPFQAAKEVLIEASSTVAKETVQKVYVQTARILLDINIQAPYIIVPRKSNSADVLIIDLGHLTMKNELEMRRSEKMESPAIIDSISLNLEELRIYLAVMDGVTVTSERALIEPLEFNLNLVRNLSSTWYQDEPDLRADARLGKVIIRLSELGCGKLVQIVFNNLKEGRNQLNENSLVSWANLWEVKPLDSLNFSFLGTETGVEGHQLVQSSAAVSESLATPCRSENMIVNFNHFEIIIETGQGNRTSPLVLFESSMDAIVTNWSSQLEIVARLNLQAGYYNSSFALWEPLLEPVEQKPWQMMMRMKRINVVDEAGKLKNRPASKLEIKFDSLDTVELTVTRSFLDVVFLFGKTFSGAVNQERTQRDPPTSRYVVNNQLDRNVVISLQDCEFTLDNLDIAGAGELELKSGSKVGLKPKPRTRQVLSELHNETERMLTIKIPDLSYSHSIPVSRSSRRYLPVGRSPQDENNGFVADICNDFGFRSITFRGVVQIHNHFQQPIEVFNVKTGNGVGQVEECGILNVPPCALSTDELFFSPLGYDVSEPFVWPVLQQRQNPSSKVLECSSKQSNGDRFFMQVTGNVEHIYLEDTQKKTSFCYEIHLRPTIILHNSLPIPLNVRKCKTENELTLPAGATGYFSSVKILGADSMVMKIKYMDQDWSTEEIRSVPNDSSVVSFKSLDGAAKATLDLGVSSTVKDGTLHMTIYCPFWMINNTGLLLTYMGEEDNCTIHPENTTDPVLFSFRPKSFLTIRVKDSNWSDRFSIDVVGSSRLVTCQTEEGKDNQIETIDNPLCYQLGVTVNLSHEGLTKQVIFTPCYIFSNLAAFDIDVCEERDGPPSTPDARREWIAVGAGQSVPFWPHRMQKRLIFRVAGTNEETLAISLDKPQPTLLRLNNNFGGLFIDFKVSESSFILVFHPYEDGRAPLMLVNHSQRSISINEYESSSVELAPHHACYYTWQQPNGARTLTLRSGNFKREFSARDVTRTSSGNFSSSALQWISFLHGRQRVLLVTEDKKLALQQRNSKTAEPAKQSVSVSLHGLGISLVDNTHRREILYAGITSSGVIWETAKMNRTPKVYRAVSNRDNILLEEAYQQYLHDLKANQATSSRFELDNGQLSGDFNEFKLYQPNERGLRRSFGSGLEFIFEKYSNRRIVQARLNKMQIDNKLDDCVFPIVFAPVPPPRSIFTDSMPRPFVEMENVELIGTRANVQHYIEYFKLLVQECRFRVDMSLINGVGSFFVNEEKLKSELELKKSVLMDIESAKQGLHARMTRLLDDKAPGNYFEMLHLSPLKIHLSFSNTGNAGAISSAQLEASDNPASQLLNLFVQSVGISLMEVQDVVFQLGFFERSDIFYSWHHLAQDLKWHYADQAVKQFYVLVFGLDVIGNPYGLVVGITQGVEQFFYEPFQGAIQGPEEFLDGLALSSRGLLGHTVGGVASGLSKITGTLGKGLSYLTFDEDYQKNRRQTLLRRPTDIGENLASGAKEFVESIGESISGVALGPLEGAQRGGIFGCCAGLGVGLVGLLLKPIVAVADFATRSLDVIKRAVAVNEEFSPLRPPRFLHPDGIVRSYNRYQADGNCLLKALDKGRFVQTDYYVDHALTEKGSTLLITDRRVVLMSLDYFGQWKVKWRYSWAELTQLPQVIPDGLFIPLGINRGRLVRIQPQERCEILRQQIAKFK